MKKYKKNIVVIKILICVAVLFTACTNKKDHVTYRNPVVNLSLPDPSIIQLEDSFYLYATEDVRNVPIYSSADLVNWKFVGTVFNEETRPNFEPKGGIWAPDINKIADNYVLYYSMSVWGGEWTCGIGVAIADNPKGPFLDKGILFRSNEIGVQNSIDPFYIEDNGVNYLFWGSFSGLYVIELSSDGLLLASGAFPTRIAGSAYEGSYIHKRGDYYYFFASSGTCCEGISSTYHTVVGRSKSLIGPYVNRKGESMMDNCHELVLQKNELFVGTGHNSEIVTDKAGNDWILYHAVDVSDPSGRVLMLDRVHWIDGWPQIGSKVPSSESLIPNF